MISVVTATHNTPDWVLARTWASLKVQTFTNWEWVVWDDSTNDNVWRQIYGFAADERYKISLSKSHCHSGIIGAVKRNGFMVARGDILVELDHDDELTPDALEKVHQKFIECPNAGFVYSDWCEILPSGESGKYPDGWAFGYGAHYWSDEHNVCVMSAPPVNPTTIRHIVSAPNHIRAWRAATYRELGGHNPELGVADDYELMVRTYLTTEMVHIPNMLYKQHIGEHTAQRQQNDAIQRLVAEISANFEEQMLLREQIR